MHRFLVVIEKANGNYSAYCPDLPGCVAAGNTYEEAEGAMHEALRMHLEGLEEDGLAIPDAAAHAGYMAV
jgi:predicted RNase H-like HicB family nuclease